MSLPAFEGPSPASALSPVWASISLNTPEVANRELGGNELNVDPDRGDITLDLLADVFGPIEVIAIGPAGSPLPVTGHCTRCGSGTTRYGPAGSPLCDECRAGGASQPPKPA